MDQKRKSIRRFARGEGHVGEICTCTRSSSIRLFRDLDSLGAMISTEGRRSMIHDRRKPYTIGDSNKRIWIEEEGLKYRLVIYDIIRN